MSKKMMKRSLALGALMAFVITGSAMAAERTFGVSGDITKLENGGIVIFDGAYKVDSPDYISSENSETFNVIGKEISIKGINPIYVAANWGAGTSRSGTINLGTDDTEAINVEFTKSGIVAFYANSIVNVKGKSLSLTSSADSAIALWASNTSGIDQNIKSKIIISENTDTVINLTGNDTNAINVTSGGTVEVKGGLIAKADRVIAARGNSTVKINESGKNDVKLEGDILFDPTGSSYDDAANANINVNLSTVDSYFKGAIKVAENNHNQTSENVSGMRLGLSNGATWNVTDNSFVNTLNGDGGKMELATLETDNGKRLVEVKIGQNNATNLTIYGDETLTKDIENGEVKQDDALGYIAGAVEGANKNTTVAIAEGEIIGEITASVGADGEVVADSVKEAVNPVNKSIGEASVVGMAHIRAHMNDMNKRMGELRMANGEAGIWTRMVRGEEEFAGAKSQYNQCQLGYDEKLSVDKRWTVGAAVTFAEGNGNFANGSTENDSTAFAIYGSKLNNDGTFVDLIARYARFESDITVADAKSDYSTNGMSVSAEFGKRIQQGNGLWIEPQFELTYGSVDSAEYKLGDKIVQVGDMDSLIGRVGFSLGKDIKQGNVYARASYLYDFDGETETTFGNGSVTRTIEEDLGGGWFEVGVGANINLSKATYIYADVEKTFGGEVDTNWKWNLGVRYSF